MKQRSHNWQKDMQNYQSPSIIKIEGMVPYLLDSKFKEYFLGKDIIDLGCGPGHIAKIICEKYEVNSYTGIDYSESFINFAKTTINSTLVKCQFIQKDIRNLNQINGNYDTVLCLNVLPIFNLEEDINLIFNTIKKSLKPFGRLILMTTYDSCILSKECNENFQVTLSDATSEPITYKLKVKNIDGNFFEFTDNCWSVKFLENKFKEFRLKIIEVNEIGNTQLFSNTYPFISFVLAKEE